MIRILLSAALIATLPCHADPAKEPKRDGETSTGKITEVDGEDAGMNAAMAEARKEFPAFWKAISADRKKAKPELQPAMVKAGFNDEGREDSEHLWIDKVAYDGKTISGEVASEPSDLKSVKLGQKVSFPLERLSDWLYVEKGEAKGAFTVQYLRKKMSEAERKEHDASYPFRFPALK